MAESLIVHDGIASARDQKSSLPRLEIFSNTVAADSLTCRQRIIVIERRRLIRECLTHWLSTNNSDNDVVAFASIEEWEASSIGHDDEDMIIHPAL